MCGQHRHVPRGPPSSWKGGREPRLRPPSPPLGASAPATGAPPPASLSPDGPHSVMQVVVGVHPAPVPPPALAQEKAHSAASTANALVRGLPEPALLVWACLPSRWDAPGQEALSVFTPVSPGPVRFVDQRIDCALKPSLLWTPEPSPGPWVAARVSALTAQTVGPTLREAPFHPGAAGVGDGEADLLPLQAHLPPGQELHQLPQWPLRPSGPPASSQAADRGGPQAAEPRVGAVARARGRPPSHPAVPTPPLTPPPVNGRRPRCQGSGPGPKRRC